MDAELSERVLVCLRGCDIGESISADGIADEIGEKLSDVYDAIEGLENAKLVEMHPAHRKGSDPTYTLTPKGKRHMQPEVQERPEPDPAKEDHDAPEPRPSADRMCRFCKREMEPNKVRRHERFCKANPDRDMPGGRAPKFLKKAEPKEEAGEVPAPAEYAEEDPSNATATVEFEASIEEPTFAPNPDHCAGCANYIDGGCDEGCETDGDCNHARRPAESQLQDVPSVEEILGQQQAAEADVPDEIPVHVQDVLVLKGSPGMDAALRLIALCHQALEAGADIHLNASVHVARGLDVSIYLDTAEPEGDSQ